MSTMELSVIRTESLEDMIYNYSDSTAMNIQAAIQKYRDLGNPEMTRKAIHGGIAYVFSKFEMAYLYCTKPIESGSHRLGQCGFTGGLKWLGSSTYFRQCLLKDLDRPIPFEILNKVPSDWGDKAMVFYQNHDPIIALPIGEPAGFYSTDRGFFRRCWHGKKVGRDGWYAGVFRW